MSEGNVKKTKLIARPEDVSSPDAIIKATYDNISGPAGNRNWYRERTLFIKGAILIPIGKRIHKDGDFEIMSLDEWIEDTSKYLEENDFYETEIMRKMYRYGDIMHVFSTYEARTDPEGKPIARGINCLQLLHKDDRWWIVSIMWDNESKENPIPEEFLPYLW